MNCMVARQKLGALIHERLRADQSAALRRHLLACNACHDEYEYQARLISPLRELAPVEPPADLAITIRLRVSTPRPTFRSRLQLNLSHWMRPVALPAAGGLLTALILFGMLVPAVGSIRAPGLRAAIDVPTALSTDPRFKQASILPVSEDLLVEAWIDEQGKVSGIQVLNAVPGEAASQALDSQIGEVLLTTSFEPATRFGQRTSGKVLLALRRITIRG